MVKNPLIVVTPTMTDEATTQLQKSRGVLWVLNVVMMVYLFFWLSWALTTWTPGRHLPGLLISDHWSSTHMLTMVQLLFFAVPWSLAFMSDAPRQEWRRLLHLMIVLVLFLLSVALLGVNIWRALNANVATADNALNPANDERWCCLYAALNPTACPYNPCAVVPPATSLSWGFTFGWSFGFLIGWMLLILVDVLIVHYVFRASLLHYEWAHRANNDMESQDDNPNLAVKNQLPFHIRRQQELNAAVAACANTAPVTINALKKYAGRNSKR